MLNFREVISLFDLDDIGFMGNPWSYDNKQKGDHNVKVWLDRVVASTPWSACFPRHRMRHLASPHSDHSPLPLSWDVISGLYRWNTMLKICHIGNNK